MGKEEYEREKKMGEERKRRIGSRLIQYGALTGRVFPPPMTNVGEPITENWSTVSISIANAALIQGRAF